MPTIDIVKPYNRDKAVEYAHTWAFKRNPAYYNFDPLGGDCTNFASQVLYSGSGVMNFQPVYGWYFVNANNRSPSWSGVEFLYNFLIDNKGKGPFAEKVDVGNIMPGDLIQLSFMGDEFQHTPIVVQTANPADFDNILVTTHTFDSDNRSLSSYHWNEIRFLHILGVRV
jgi:hypothetical protein